MKQAPKSEMFCQNNFEVEMCVKAAFFNRNLSFVISLHTTTAWTRSRLRRFETCGSKIKRKPYTYYTVGSNSDKGTSRSNVFVLIFDTKAPYHLDFFYLTDF